jgi:hypothetical protein
MYFSDQVRTQLVNNKHKFINEFLVCQNIGRGSYSKVKKVIRVTDKNQLKEIELQQLNEELASKQQQSAAQLQPVAKEAKEEQKNETPEAVDRRARGPSPVRVSRMSSPGRGARGSSPARGISPGRNVPQTALSEDDGDDDRECEFAMKMMHKPTLQRERAIRYDTEGEYEIINNLEKVYLEIEIWS